MRNFSILIFVIILLSCSSNSKKEGSESNIVTNFLTDISTLETIEKGNPIVQFQELAKTMADKVIVLTKDNIKASLKEAEAFQDVVVTAGDHTIVKVLNLNDCKDSGSWSACMPLSKGYIKKSTLQLKEDYMNNIVGLPDSQKRILFLFN